MTVIVMCFNGYILVIMRDDIQSKNEADVLTSTITLFAGSLFEVLFLASLLFITIELQYMLT